VRRRHVILTFHGIGEPPAHVDVDEARFWVDQDRLEATLDLVAPRRDVLVTFDDGNRSDIEIALPALRRRRMTGCFFIVAERLDQAGYLTGDDVRALSGAGMTVGFHGLRHKSWRSLTDAELKYDLERGRSLLEEALARRVTEASCPFGEYDRRVLRHLRGLGHERVYTSDGGAARSGAWLQPRNTVEAHYEPTDAGLSGEEPARERLLRSVKRTLKRLR
jgi:peptidoglycan/xylan/chitin deacetylase (PgdA/CDA1 family)